MRSVRLLGRTIRALQVTYLLAGNADDDEELGHGGVACIERRIESELDSVFKEVVLYI